jgi:hypothetical protein
MEIVCHGTKFLSFVNGKAEQCGTEHLGVSGGECLVSVMRTTGA